MVSQHGPEAPRGSRGASSWARRVNDGTAEWLAATARVTTVASFYLFVISLAAAILPGGSLLAALLLALLALAVMAITGWLGFIYLANPEWSASDDDA